MGNATDGAGRLAARPTGRARGGLRRGVAVLALAVLVVTGCGSDDGTDDGAGASTSAPAGDGTDDGAVALSDLDGRTFTSTAVRGRDLVADTVVRLDFDGASLSVHAGCNTTTGEVAVADDGTLAWSGQPFSTLMGCADDVMDQDTWIAGLLTEGVTASLDGATLTLSGGDVTIELAEQADAELQGTTWTLETLIEDEAASSLPAGVEAPTLDIAEDGTVTVATGCNTGGTSVTVEGDTLRFEPLRLTMMACEGEAGAVEAAVAAVLDGEVTFEIDGTSLHLTTGTSGLSFRGS